MVNVGLRGSQLQHVCLGGQLKGKTRFVALARASIYANLLLRLMAHRIHPNCAYCPLRDWHAANLDLIRCANRAAALLSPIQTERAAATLHNQKAVPEGNEGSE
ncbi:MAG: hypothetical protein ACRCV4_16110 [Hafnia alvei]